MIAQKHITYEVKRIFIGSPGDVPKEREMFRDIINHVNEIKANIKGIMLEPVGWEDTLPGKGRPQEIINEDLIGCDLAVMILWKRWGSDTAKYSSGFEEEYEIAKKNEIDIWFHFRNISEDMLSDPGPQLEKVIKFKDKIESEKRYLFKVYDNEEEWKDLLIKDLCKWIDKIGIDPSFGNLPETTPDFQGLQDASDYITSLSKLKAGADKYIVKQKEIAINLVSQANKFADKGRISKAEEHFAKAHSISNEPFIINEFGAFLWRIGKIERAGDKFLDLYNYGQSTNNKILQSIGLGNLAVVKTMQGELEESKTILEKAFEIDKETDRKEGISSYYTSLGNIYQILGKFDDAEEVVKKALDMDLELGDESGVASSYANLGLIYGKKNMLSEAETYIQKAIKINSSIDRKIGLSSNYGNLGIVFTNKGDAEQAMIHLNMAIEIDTSIGNKAGLGNHTANIAIAYDKLGEISKSENSHLKAIQIYRELGNREGLANVYTNLGLLYQKEGKLEEANNMFNKW